MSELKSKEELFKIIRDRIYDYYPYLDNTEIENKFITFIKDYLLLYDVLGECLDYLSVDKAVFFEDWQKYVLKVALSEKFGETFKP